MSMDLTLYSLSNTEWEFLSEYGDRTKLGMNGAAKYFMQQGIKQYLSRMKTMALAMELETNVNNSILINEIKEATEPEKNKGNLADAHDLLKRTVDEEAEEGVNTYDGGYVREKTSTEEYDERGLDKLPKPKVVKPVRGRMGKLPEPRYVPREDSIYREHP